MGNLTSAGWNTMPRPRSGAAPCRAIEIVAHFRRLLRRSFADETLRPCDETIFCIDAELRKQRVVNQASPDGGRGVRQPGDSPMRTLSFILAFGIGLIGPSVAGSSDAGLPGIGTFAYVGSPVVSDTVMVAAR